VRRCEIGLCNLAVLIYDGRVDLDRLQRCRDEALTRRT
jgi:hypothetical protein